RKTGVGPASGFHYALSQSREKTYSRAGFNRFGQNCRSPISGSRVGVGKGENPNCSFSQGKIMVTPGKEFFDQFVQEDVRHFSVQRISDLPNTPPPVVIQGLLYQGGKLLISAPSKSRKSFLIFELLYCCANGFTWWGKSVLSGQVLLLNFELMPWEVRARFEMIQASYKTGDFNHIDVINLRGLQFRYAELSVIARDAGTQKYVLAGLD